MKILLFILGLSFFFIFYMFYTTGNIEETFFMSVFIEANLYVFIALIFAFLVWKSENTLSLGDETKEESSSTLSSLFQSISIRRLLFRFFERYIYLLAIGLFYISLFLFLHVFFPNIQIEQIFLFFNISVLGLYFLEDTFDLFQDLLRVNTSVISLYYIFLHINYILFSTPIFSFVDIVNILIVWGLFYLFSVSSRGKKYIPEFYTYILLFFFLECMVGAKYLIGEVYDIFMLLSSVLAGFFLLYTSEVSKQISLEKKYIRIWGLIFSYIFIVFFGRYIFLYNELLYLYFPILLVLMYLLYIFHVCFQNYISLLFALVGGCIGSLALFMGWGGERSSLGVFLIIISALYLFVYQLFGEKNIYDSYFVHVFSIVVNIVGCVLFVLFYDVSILSISLLLMGESIYLFYSYYTLSKSNS